ncbi:MAG TPA: DUF3857 domain-containing protein [Chitinophagaceae bacterium]|nr:DUF3857 domain-containing protein [Chitinophagaceae bacterium]
MRKRPLFFICLFFTLPLFLSAQLRFPEFGIYTGEELMLTNCPFDKEADAIVLLDQAISNYDDEYQLITTRRIRIKILHQRGLDKGNINIRFYARKKFETIRDIKAMTYNTDDGTNLMVTKNMIFTEKLNDYYSTMKFAMPAVRVGSIIEYEYTSVMENYGGLDEWVFQSELPTIKSCYELQMVPNYDFSYVVSKSKLYPIIIRPDNQAGNIYYEMNNIPGLRYEPYMDAPRDYLQKVEFQFSGYNRTVRNTGYTTETEREGVNETWKDIVKNLSSNKELGGTTKTNLSIPAELKTMVEGEVKNREKIRLLFNYVRDNFIWNHINSKSVTAGLKKVWENKTGTSGEINLLLVCLLQSFKLDAWPLLAAERDYGKVFPEYPLIDRFNTTVAYVNDNGTVYILDATLKHLPFGLVPYPLLNTYALLLDSKSDAPVLIQNKSADFRNSAIVKMTIGPEGNINGNAEIKSEYYAKEFFINAIKRDEKKYIGEYITAGREGFITESFSYDYPGPDTGSLQEHVKFSSPIDKSGGFLIFNYNVFTGLTRNLFVSDVRFTNVNFGYPQFISCRQFIDLPAGSSMEKLPPDTAIFSPAKDISISRAISVNGNQLEILMQFRQTVTLVLNSDYPTLKGFYKKMVDMLNEPVVIKIGK